MLCWLRQVDTLLFKGEGSFRAQRITRRTGTVLFWFSSRTEKQAQTRLLSNHCWRRHSYPVSVVDCRWLIQSVLLKHARKGLLSLSQILWKRIPSVPLLFEQKVGKNSLLCIVSALAVCPVPAFCLSWILQDLSLLQAFFVAYPVFSLYCLLLSGFLSYSSRRAPCINFSYVCVWCNQAACPMQQSVNSLWDQSKPLLV